MSLNESCVLLSFVDLRTDPYGRGRDGQRDKSQAGPTLTLLFDPESPYRGKVSDMVMFYRQPDQDPAKHLDKSVAEATRKEVERLGGSKKITITLIPWQGEDPTDHQNIFGFLRAQLEAVREQHPEKKLVIHISPGTPAMQTVWVLMAEVGMIRPPFVVVKSLRRAHRAGRPAVVPVELGIPTFYKAFRTARPKMVTDDTQPVLIDPRKFVSDKLSRLYSDAQRYARLNVPVLILGERGTGKTTLASWIRSSSPFRQAEKDQSWPSVPCSQYSPETMRAELFGYVKGAFTDARQDTEGLLHMANGDTLFLDEIGDISRDLQRMLIRALEEKQFTRVGGKVPEKSAFRLISATNQPWDQLKERLDLDFLDRISVLILEVPPLREVREDLPWLWRHIFSQAIYRAGVRTSDVHVSLTDHERIIRYVQQHPLPGNLRDLFRVAYHLIANTYEIPLANASGEDAVSNALNKALGARSSQDESYPVARKFAAAYAEASTIDALIPDNTEFSTREVERAIRKYMAEEIRRVARVRGVKPQSLCDVTDRTLQKWVKGDVDA